MDSDDDDDLPVGQLRGWSCANPLVESIWGCPGAYLELLLVSVVRRGPHDGSGEFSQNVAILG